MISPKAAAQGYSVSLMERLMHRFEDQPEQISRRLVVQYRMHQSIMGFSSRVLYEGALEAHQSVRSHLLCDFSGVGKEPLTVEPVYYIDTAGASYDERQEAGGESRLNPREAELTAAKVNQLIQAGVPAEHIGVITPYAAQVRLLLELLPGEIEVNSVDGFQGREKEASLISLVRANPEGNIGFLADERRMNVALTRARRSLVVIGDSGTVSVHPFYKKFLDYIDEIGAYHSVWEEGVI